MAYVPCRLVRQERMIGGKRLRFPPITFTRDARSRGSDAINTIAEIMRARLDVQPCNVI